jgi:hypothetical protein
MNGLERLATIRNISVQKGKQWVHKDIFRLLNKEDLWIVAYNNIYARKKVGNECLNEFEIKKLREIKTSVMNETYSPVFIKKLPIHLSDQTYFDTDHIVIELIRIILESIFEPLFCDSNFGYIQNKNAHATLKYIEDHFKVCDFLIQGEFEKIYQSIDYNILTKVINKYVKDVRFNNLIRKLLNSGLLYNRKKERNSILKAYETTRLQELFLNIYINEFDNWIEDYLKISIKNPRTVHNIEFSKIQYVRYMDTWILGIETDQILALHIKKKVETFLLEHLYLALTTINLVCLTSGTLSFLDYEIYLVRSSYIEKRANPDYKTTTRLRFDIPINKLLENLEKNGIIKSTLSGYKPISKSKYTRLEDHRIVLHFTFIWNSLKNYYSGITNPQKLQYIYWLLRISCAMTLAHKHNSTCTQIFKKNGKSLTVEIPSKKQKVFFESKMLKNRKWKTSKIIINPFKILQT